MGIAQDIEASTTDEAWHAALAALAWQIDLGLSDISAEAPLNRYALPEPIKAPPPAAPVALPPRAAAAPPEPEAANPQAAIQAARDAAARATNLEDLRTALAAFDHCDLKKGARNLVFSDGNPKARVLILTEAPDTEEDREGRPFVGRNGQMLDLMFAAIGLDRTSPDPATALYLINISPWRTPNREADPAEIALLRPFVKRHIELAAPDVIVLMGNGALQCVLRQQNIQRARGAWAEALSKPVLPMLHPMALLRNPAAKREAWADLLSLQVRLRA